MSGDPTFFRDGYTRRARIAAKPGVYGELIFEFRPVAGMARDRMNLTAKNEHPDKVNKAAYDLLAKHVVCVYAKMTRF